MARRDVPMSVRRAIVEADVSSLNVRAFCADHGISKSFFYELRKRYAAEGDAALEPRSRAPKRVANRTSDEVIDQIVRLRKQLSDDGHDAGPLTIAWHLERWLGDEMACPSPATIWRVLRARGFIIPEPAKAPGRALRRFQAERANECWQIDATGWVLADGTEVDIVNALDDRSRLAVASRALPSACTKHDAFDTLAAGAHRYGWPERVLSDNGRAFTALDEPLAAIGVATRRSKPYHPQTCGKVERFHQTLKQYLTRHQPATLDQLQACLDTFTSYYNQQRPHRALGRRIPAEVWAATPKAGPADTPLDLTQPPETQTFFTTVKPDGRVNILRRYRIPVGIQHAGKPVTVVITDTRCHIFHQGQVLRALQLDPTKIYQPLHNRPGRPAATR